MPKMTQITHCFIILSILFFSNCSDKKQFTKYPISAEIFTTNERIIVPDAVPATAKKLLPYELSQYHENGYGKWHYDYIKESKANRRRLDLMPAGYTGQAVTNATTLLRFFSISDIHITDKESPAQAICLGYKGGLPQVYSGMMLYTTHVLDAAIQTINALHKSNAFDFGISLGDVCNATQYNELRWYIDVIDGKEITPSSGDHAGAQIIDYQKPYKAAGLDKTIKWYQVLGNHDHFWMGFLPANEYVKKTLIGKNIINLGDVAHDPRGLDSRGFYMGALDGKTPYGDVMGAGKTENFKTPPTVHTADANRRALSRNEWIGEFFKTSSKPKGHGFSQENIQTGFACYTFEPKATIPLKIIVLDNTQSDLDPHDPVALGYAPGSYGYGHAALDTERYNWLIKELDKGQREDKLMIIAAHIPIGFEFEEKSLNAWNKKLKEKLIAKLHSYPNFIMWIAGHLHINKITALKSPDDKHPECGFWEVQTSSLRDFPQQFRSFEIIKNSDNTISIRTTNIDPAVQEGSPAAASRSYAVATRQIFAAYYKKNLKEGVDFDAHNAELLKQLTPRMQKIIQMY